MPITQRDMPGIQEGANKLASLILGSQQQAKQAELEKQLELQKAQEMLPIQRQQAQQQSDINYAQSQRERQSAIDTAKQMMGEGLVNEGGGLSVGKDSIGITRGVDPNRVANQEDKILGAEAREVHKQGRGLDDLSDVLDQIKTIHALAKSPNAYDQKNLAVLQARIAEGKGQKLLQSVIQSFGGTGQSAPGWLAGMANKVQGGAAATITPEEMRQLVEHTYKMGDEFSSRFSNELDKFKQVAPSVAVRTARINPAAVENMINSHAKKGLDAINELNASKQQYQETAAKAGRVVPAAPPPQEQGTLAWLLGKAGINRQSQQAAPSGLTAEQEARRQELLKKAQGQ